MARQPLMEITGVVDDALCRDQQLVESDGSEYFTHVIVITIKDINSGQRYYCELHSEDIQALAGLSRELTPLEMMRYAEILRSTEAKFPLMVDPDASFVSAEMISLKPQKPKPAPRRRATTVSGFNKEQIKKEKSQANVSTNTPTVKRRDQDRMRSEEAGPVARDRNRT